MYPTKKKWVHGGVEGNTPGVATIIPLTSTILRAKRTALEGRFMYADNGLPPNSNSGQFLHTHPAIQKLIGIS